MLRMSTELLSVDGPKHQFSSFKIKSITAIEKKSEFILVSPCPNGIVEVNRLEKSYVVKKHYVNVNHSD